MVSYQTIPHISGNGKLPSGTAAEGGRRGKPDAKVLRFEPEKSFANEREGRRLSVVC
jgi:hypothetical protein